MRVKKSLAANKLTYSQLKMGCHSKNYYVFFRYTDNQSLFELYFLFNYYIILPMSIVEISFNKNFEESHRFNPRFSKYS